jgi:serine/threonine protein kinase
VFRVGSNGTVPYSAPEVTSVSNTHITRNSRKSDAWSWGAVLYRMTYDVPPDYTAPCYRLPSNQHPAHEPCLLSVLRHTLLIDPKERYSALQLAQHQYTKMH